jgi:hypothetical protein
MDFETSWPADGIAPMGSYSSVTVALAWAEMVLDGRLADAWARTGALFRLAVTRRWSWAHRAALQRRGHDPMLVAGALAGDGPDHALWPEFARSQAIPGGGQASEGAWVAAGSPEPVGPDLEVVRLARAETVGLDHHAPPLTLVLRLGCDGWLVAGLGRSPADAPWPPVRPPMSSGGR